jgi:hypothetical protein
MHWALWTMDIYVARPCLVHATVFYYPLHNSMFVTIRFFNAANLTLGARGTGGGGGVRERVPLFFCFTVSALQIILDLCIPVKELAQTHSQILFIYFQSHS